MSLFAPCVIEVDRPVTELPPIERHFAESAPPLAPKDTKRLEKQNAYILEFLHFLDRYQTEDDINNPDAEIAIYNAFYGFLQNCGFYSAQYNFETLLDLKSGDKKYRSDGTINWYHELGPIVHTLSLIRAGRDGGGIDLSDMESEGGLEVDISTKLNHDRIEDTLISREVFAEEQFELATTYLKMVEIHSPIIARHYTPIMMDHARLVDRNVWLMTRKVARFDEQGNVIRDATGKPVRDILFRNNRNFFLNMCSGGNEDANPVSFTSKQADIATNMSSLTFSEKHTPQKSLEFINSYEDICGARNAVVRKGQEAWPAYANLIRYWDSVMGFCLYLEAGWLEHVDFVEAESNRSKFRPGEAIYESDIYRFLEAGALSIPVPRAFSFVHTAIDRKRALAEKMLLDDTRARLPEIDQRPDSIRRHDGMIYLTQGIYPALAPFRGHFPEIPFDIKKTDCASEQSPRSHMGYGPPKGVQRVFAPA